MPIINVQNDTSCNISFYAQTNSHTIDQISAYCSWAGIYDLGYFLEKATAALLSSDNEFQEKITHQPLLKII